MELEEQVAALSARVAELEDQVAALRATRPPPPAEAMPPAPAPPPVAGAQPAPPPPPPAMVAPPPVPAPAPAPPSRPEWLTTETLLKWAGVLLVVLAAVFFVGTAISRGWIGPELQLAGATAGGLAMVAGGFHLSARNRAWASALATGGAVVLSVCAAAANAGLDLIGEYPALVVLGLVTIGLGEVGRRLSAASVAAAAGLAAAILPLWIVEDIDLPPVVLGGWMAALVIGASAFGWLQGWAAARLPTVAVAALVLFGLIASEADAFSTGERSLALVVVAIVAAVAWAGPVAGRWLGRAGDETAALLQGLDHRAVLSIPLWAWGSAVMAADLDTDRAVAVTGFGLAALFVAVATVAWRRLPTSVGAAHLLGAGVLVSISMAILTDGPSLLVGLAAQAAATGLIAWRIGDRWLLGLAAVLGVGAVGWAAQSTAEGVFDQLGTGQLLANLFVLALLGGAAFLHWRQSDDGHIGILVVVTWVGLLGWIASAFGHRPQGQVVVSLLWSFLAAAALIHGVRSDDSGARLLGIGTLGVVLVKLLTVDLAEVDTLWRVGLFLVVGSGLLRLGYVLPSMSAVEDRTGDGDGDGDSNSDDVTP